MRFLTPKGYKEASELVVGEELLAFDKEGNQVVNVIKEISPRYDEDYCACNTKEEPVLKQDGKVDDTKQPVKTVRPFAWYLVNGVKMFCDQSIWKLTGPGLMGAVHVENLQVGDILWNEDDKEVTVDTIEPAEPEKVWYALEVSGNHGAIADGFAVHNASRYWVGGGSTTNWNATANTNWGSASNTQDNSSVPGTSDAVFFDGVGVGASDSNLSANITINSLDCNGYANSLTRSAGAPTISGNGVTIRFSSGMTLGSGFSPTFTGTSGTNDLTTNGKQPSGLNVNGTGGTLRLLDSLTQAPGANFTLTRGTFNTNGQNWTLGGAVQRSGTNTIVLTITSSLVTLTGTGNVYNISDPTSFTLNATGSTIKITDTSATAKNFMGGGKTFGTLEFAKGAGTSTDTITGSNTFASLKNSGSAAFTIVFDNGGTTTLSSAAGWLLNGTAGNLLSLTSVTGGTAWNLSCASGTVAGDYLSLKDSAAAGGATFNASHSTNVSGNSGWNFITSGNTSSAFLMF